MGALVGVGVTSLVAGVSGVTWLAFEVADLFAA